MATITSGEFSLLKDFLYRSAGIDLVAGKEYLAAARLAEVCKNLEVPSVSSLIRQLGSGRKELKVAVVEAMTTNETSFFRDQAPFSAVVDHILPELISKRSDRKALRIWSAACSTGQEPYSIAIALKENFPELRNWKVTILGTDIAEQKVLEKARSGRFTQHEVSRGLPAKLLVRYFQQKGRDWMIRDDIREMVNFRKVNLLEVPSFLGQFDLLLCRNVLIYFDNPTKQKILATLKKHLHSDGYLMLGGTELLIGLTQSLKRRAVGKATCYQLESR